MSNPQTHIVPPVVPPQRLQEYGVGVFGPIATKSALKKALKKQLIRVNDKVATTATMINGGETIVFTPLVIDKPQRTFNLKLNVLFEDDYLAAIYKPAGVLVSGNSFRTITNALPQNIARSSQEDALKLQPVHRLDFATTGILLVGKTAESIRQLAKMFEQKEIEKTYYAVTIDSMDQQGIIKEPIDQKEAISRFEKLDSLNSERFKQLNLVKLYPDTGRRHQLRIHMAGLGNPILGDRDYTPEPLILKGKGMYLHAYSVEFVHPFSNQNLRLTAPLPERFIKLFPDFKY